MAEHAATPEGEVTDARVDPTPSIAPAATHEEPAQSPQHTPAAPEATATETPSSTLVAADAAAERDADGKDGDVHEADRPVKPTVAPHRLAVAAGLVIVVSLTALTGWLGVRAYHSQQAKAQQELFMQVARQGALNLTTIDYQHADGDVQRILDSATGQFHDDFSKRSQPFVDVVRQAQSKSVGTVAEAGVESESATQAQVLVAVRVQTSSAGSPDQKPRAWRMRLTVQKVGDEAKVSNVEFVP
ncbi:MAG: Mce protein [Mycobacterium sp.]